MPQEIKTQEASGSINEANLSDENTIKIQNENLENEEPKKEQTPVVLDKEQFNKVKKMGFAEAKETLAKKGLLLAEDEKKVKAHEYDEFLKFQEEKKSKQAKDLDENARTIIERNNRENEARVNALQKEIENQKKQNEEMKHKFIEQELRQRLLAEANMLNAINPNDVVELAKRNIVISYEEDGKYKFTPVDELGTPLIGQNVEPLTPEEFLKTWVNLDNKKHHFKPQIHSGSGVNLIGKNSSINPESLRIGDFSKLTEESKAKMKEQYGIKTVRKSS